MDPVIQDQNKYVGFESNPRNRLLKYILVFISVFLIAFFLLNTFQVRRSARKISSLIKAGSCYYLDGNTCSLRKDCYWAQEPGPLGQFSEDSPCQKIKDKKLINRNDYCSLNNGCPSDKCVEYFPCIDGSYSPTWGFNCYEYSKHPDDCRYKDQSLKENYYEVNITDAKKCFTEFAANNQIEYPLLKYLEVNDVHPNYTGKFQRCSDPEIGLTRHDGDTYCLNLPLIRSTGSNMILPEEDIRVVVGAQTCNVYFTYPETSIFKIEDPGALLSENLYTKEEALGCAENYLLQNRNSYKEYQSYQTGTLKLYLDKETGFPYHDLTKDWKYYHFWSEVSEEKYIFLNVGTHTCTVYPDFTERLTKLQ